MLLIVAALSAMLAANPPPAFSTCSFHLSGPRWAGSCGRLLGEEPQMQLVRTTAIATGMWRKNVPVAEVWAGEMTVSGGGRSPIELEIDNDGVGVLRTEYGWFPVSGLTVSASVLAFTIDAVREVRPSELDRQIVQRADAILSSPAVWNRLDNRRCPESARSWSIYCAAERATIEVTGGFHHRRPAMELVRRIIEERSAGRRYNHRLMDYNNDPSTRFEDVHTLFAEALARIDRAP